LKLPTTDTAVAWGAHTRNIVPDPSGSANGRAPIPERVDGRGEGTPKNSPQPSPEIDNGAMPPFDLDRFVEAQSGVYERALEELRRGRKTGHWIWFVFPQIAGLGRSATSQLYAIGSLAEARAYLDQPGAGASACASAPSCCSRRSRARRPRRSSASSTR